MKKFILPISAILLAFSNLSNANQVIHLDKQAPVIHWMTYSNDQHGDGIEIHVEGKHDIIITTDRQYEGKATCRIDVDGCTSIAALQPGDIALCHPTTQAIFFLAQCGDAYGVSSGTIRFVKG